MNEILMYLKRSKDVLRNYMVRCTKNLSYEQRLEYLGLPYIHYREDDKEVT